MALDRILIVEPDSKIVHLLRQLLTDGGFRVLITNKGERAVQMAVEEQPILVLTETKFADEMNGTTLVKRLREFSDNPIMILSSNDKPEEILQCFEAGADDYITKPFDSRILLARVKAVLKRSQSALPIQTEISHNDLVIDLAARQVTLEGTQVYLTETEYNLLLEFARHRNMVLTHEQLLTAVWGPKFATEVDYLRSYIHILRRKLEKNPAEPALIVSRPGIGYMLT